MRGARLVSLLFQPVVPMSAVLAALALLHPRWRMDAGVLWLALVVVPSLALACGMSAGIWSDIELTQLRERRTFLPLCAALAAGAAV